jgi:hypothetical protein
MEVQGRSAVDRAAMAGLSLAAGVLLVLGAAATIRDPGLTHGDFFSDANVLIAGRNFDEHGLSLQNGLPVQDTCRPGGRVSPPYTHYPPGPEWLLQAWKALGVRELTSLRIVALGIAFAGALTMTAVFRRLTGSVLTACLAGGFYVFAPAFLALADSLHQHAYGQLTLAALLFCWLGVERAPSPRARGLALGAAAAFCFVDGWLTFEHMLLVAGFILGRLVLEQRRDLLPSAVLLWAVPALVMATRLWHNASVLGGLPAAVADLGGLDRVEGVAPEAGEILRLWALRLGALGVGPEHPERELEFPLLRPAVALPAAALLVACGLSRGTAASTRRGLRDAALLLLAGALWFVAFPTHALFHRHLVRLLLPGLALGLGSLAAGGVRLLRERVRGAAAGLVLSLGLAAGYAWAVSRSVPAARLLPLFEPARSIVRQRAAEDLRLRAGVQGLRVERCVVIGNYPPAAQAIRVPVLRPERPDELDGSTLFEGDTLWMEVWSDEERAAALAAYDRHGFPDVLGPGRMTLLFRTARASSLPVGARVEPGAVLERLRLATTLDGSSLALIGEFTGSEDARRALVFHAEVRDAKGAVGAQADMALEAEARDSKRALVWLTLPLAAVARGETLQLSFWDVRRQAFAEVSEPSGSPTVRRGGASFLELALPIPTQTQDRSGRVHEP